DAFRTLCANPSCSQEGPLIKNLATANDAIPPHDATCDGHQRRDKSEDGPDNFQTGIIAPPAEVKTAKPEKDDVARSIARIRRSPQKIHGTVERIRNAKINPRDSPHQKKEKQPETDGAVQIPIEATPAGRPTKVKTALPSRNSRPPDHNSREASHGHY